MIGDTGGWSGRTNEGRDDGGVAGGKSVGWRADGSDSSTSLGITMGLLRPHEVMKMGCCLPVGSCTCRAYPPPPPGPMDTGFRR